MKKVCHIVLTLLMCIILAIPTAIGTQGIRIQAKTVTISRNHNIPATITASSLNVRTLANQKSAQLMVKKKPVKIIKNTKVTILRETITDGQKWYYISFQSGKSTLKGFVLSNYVKLNTEKKVLARVYNTKGVKIQRQAGNKKPYLIVNKKDVKIKHGLHLSIVSESTVAGTKWYKVEFTYAKKKRTGYIKAIDTIFREIVVKKVEKDPPQDIDITPGTTDRTGIITGNNLRVRVGAGTNTAQVFDVNNNLIYLNTGHKVTIISSIVQATTTWYEIGFQYGTESLTGFISGDYVKLDEVVTPPPSDNDNGGKDVVPPIEEKPADEGQGNVNQPDPITNPALTDAEFEAAMSAQGFPDSYKPYLRQLHNLYPYWQFQAYHTGLDWNTAIINQSKVGKNLITNSKNIGWKSLEVGAYNWKTDKFIPYDGSSWVTASKVAIEHLMDPRNFLTANGVFQFELLSYQPDYQTISGVENILRNTALYNKSYEYMDDMTQQILATTYGDTFVKAAEISSVSPYHLATRVKQEVVTGTSTLSSSATGTVSGYEGYYNFFNIGATHSTSSGGAVANGLKYAMNGSSNAANNALYMIPWNNPFKSIVGGSNFIGSSYINRGQNTVYLQKFNSTSVSTYSHQYMANVEAAKAEAVKTLAAYNGMTEVPIVFSIPVYLNMPESPCPEPANVLNPNNLLASLSVDGYVLTPTFNIEDMESVVYNLIVPGNIEGINVKATPVSSKATISGNGYVPLSVGNNLVTITVTAENQNVRQYRINIVRDPFIQ